jgi:hypothetical protein
MTRPSISESGSRATPGRLLSAPSRSSGDCATKRMDSRPDHEAIIGQQAADLTGPGGALADQPGAGMAECMARLLVRRLDRRITVAVVLAIGLAGCGQFYWGKPGSTAEQFDRDSTECALEASKMPGGQVVKEVFEKAYRQCLRDRGYLREQKVGPPPGWHRGIE